ncbi:MAG TPA: ABC transporter ATP-binding protein [Mycobacteriales bacterium]|nr:ABC transporter ATP-binding protein [Mycobacteriales bacterium]
MSREDAAPLHVRAATKAYGPVTALGGVDLTVDAGAVHGLLGPNGAGKTTLLSAALGLTRLTSGELLVFGRAHTEHGPARALQGVAGFVDRPRFHPYLSARRTLQLLADLDGLDGRIHVDAVLEQVGLADAAGRRVGGFSTGMVQRLGVAAALLRRPRLLILDEPTEGLDPGGSRDLRDLLRALADDGCAVLLSSHDMAEVESTCDRATIIARGRVVADGSLTALRAQAPAPLHRLRTSDDDAALRVLAASPGLHAERADPGLTVAGGVAAVDAGMLALGAAGIAVRALELAVPPLEALFFALTDETTSAA